MYSTVVNNGYYRTHVTYDKALKYCPYASAGVSISTECITLVSYTTPVVQIDSDGWLVCWGTYSATTRKHIGAFMKEYGNGYTYYDAKKAFERNAKLNIYTGVWGADNSATGV